MAPELKAVRDGEGDSKRRNSGISRFGAAITNLYNDPFRWTMIKSWAWFAAGVWIAREMTGVDLMAPPIPA